MSKLRTVAALLATMLAAALVSGLSSAPRATADPGDPPPSDSTVTVSGKGEFADLKATVSQTKNLINQTIVVSWSGAKPTKSATEWAINFLQIMQCWGDDPAGPDRTQCQFGGLTESTKNVNGEVPTRQLNSRGVVDPLETLTPPADESVAYVPFWAVGEPKPTGSGKSNINEFFNSQVTNEIPVARTHGDGTGKEFFEVETVREAAGLGCGEPVTVGGSTTGRRCWLVIVPRGNKDVDPKGPTLSGENLSSQALVSSPLSQSNWNNRIVVPLEFQPVGQACPIGAPERIVIGDELATDAVHSWQPALCAGGGPSFSYTQLTDDQARIQLDRRLALVNSPVPPDQAADRSLVYAPVGLSALAIAFNVERQVLAPRDPHTPPDALLLHGLRFTSMKLNPRLVAKLLTQSYLSSVANPANSPEAMKKNPPGLFEDPEFSALNPEYHLNPAYLGFVDPANPVTDPLVQINGADVTSLLWSWVIADPDARAFLNGTPDQFGMRINPANQGLALPTSTVPRNDPSCTEVVDRDHGTQPLIVRTCSLDKHPFANDMHVAGRAAGRGDTLAQLPTPQNNGLVVAKPVARQNVGARALLAVVDAATAARYALPTAQLLNAAGKYVAPTTESLRAAEAAMKPSAVAGVLAPDPGASDPAAYPLTALTYAVTAPPTLDAAACKDYAAFLRYAGGPGQQPGIHPGQLPLGMVPLHGVLKAQTTAAADVLDSQACGSPASPAAQPTAEAVAGTSQNPTGGSRSVAGTGGVGTGISGAVPTAAPGVVAAAGGGVPVSTPGPVQLPVASRQRTPSLLVPAVGGVFLVILICIAVAAVNPPVLRLLRMSSLVRFLLGVLARRRGWRGVRPTER